MSIKYDKPSIIEYMKKITRVFDFILSRAIIFALAFIWCRYYIKPVYLSVAAALGATFILSLILFLISRPKKRKTAISGVEKEHMNDVINQFMYSSNRQNSEYFYGLIKNEYPATLLPECIVTENNKVKTLMFTRFTIAPAIPDDIREIIIECRKYGAKRAIVFCGAFSDKAKETAGKIEGIEIVLMNAENTYGFLKDFNLYPAITIETTQKRRKPLKVFFKYAFSRTKVKAYLWGAAIMLLGSFFVLYNLYYLISATVFLFFALLSFISFKFKQEPEKSLL